MLHLYYLLFCQDHNPFEKVFVTCRTAYIGVARRMLHKRNKENEI